MELKDRIAQLEKENAGLRAAFRTQAIAVIQLTQMVEQRDQIISAQRRALAIAHAPAESRLFRGD